MCTRSQVTRVLPGPWGRCVAEDEHLGTRWCTEPDAPKVACISFIRPSFFGTLTPALNPAPPLPFNHKRTELPREECPLLATLPGARRAGGYSIVGTVSCEVRSVSPSRARNRGSLSLVLN